MTIPTDEWRRVVALETTQDDGPPSPVGFFVGAIACLLIVVLGAGVWAGYAAARDPEVRAAQAREDSAHVRVHRAQQATAARVREAGAATVAAERAAERYRTMRRDKRLDSTRYALTPPLLVTDNPLPPVRGGWGTVTTQGDTLPTPRLVIVGLAIRDTLLTAADSVIGEQAHALRLWRGASATWATERAAWAATVEATDARGRAEVRAVRRSRWRWALTAGAVGVVSTLFLLR